MTNKNKILNYPVLGKEISRLTKSIIKEIKPEKIILFGSLARGNFNKDSDVDMLIIKKTSLLPWERKWWISRVVLDRQVGLDTLVYTPKEIKDRIKRGDIFLEEIFKEGEVLYEKKG